jgi:glycosyltransferase involved in cell wall biosynthesis
MTTFAAPIENARRGFARASDDTADLPRRRVLVSAYAVSPARGSEPAVGWNICLRLARHHDVTVLCSPEVPPAAEPFREEINAYLKANGPVPGLHFHFVEPPLLSHLCQRESTLMRRTLYYTGYRAWQKAAYREALELHRREPFDLVHQLNVTGYREPGYLWKLPVPFVWGPVGGAADVPDAFLPLMGWKERLFYRVRNRTNGLQKRAGRRCRAAARRASHVWAIGEENRRMLRERWGRDAENMIETGAVPRREGRVREFDGSRPLRLVWSGLHIGRKALPVLLHALATLNGNARPEMTVLGEGPETGRWKALAARLGLGARVRWTGRVPHEQALAEMGRADVLAFTSVQEGTPHVVLEALSLGLPVVCHDACGMGVAVTDGCGIKVPMESPDVSVKGFAGALCALAADPGAVRRLSAGALRRAAELGWDEKAARIARTYDRVLAGSRNVCAAGAAAGVA